VEQAEEKRAWFDAFREWVEGVAVFLDEKVGGLLAPGLSACDCGQTWTGPTGPKNEMVQHTDVTYFTVPASRKA
jgi:hypothetical protein